MLLVVQLGSESSKLADADKSVSGLCEELSLQPVQVIACTGGIFIPAEVALKIITNKWNLKIGKVIRRFHQLSGYPTLKLRNNREHPIIIGFC